MLASANPRLQALLRNAGTLLTGNAVNGLLGLAYIAIVTWALGLEQFGLYGLYIAYIGLFTRLTTFQTWQALIAFGTPAYEKKDNRLLLDLLGMAWLLDLAGGLLGYGLAVLGAMMVPVWFGLGEDAVTNVVIAAAMLIFNWRNIPTALLRIYDRFIPQAVFNNVTSGLQLIAIGYLYWQGEQRLLIYLAVTTVNNIIGQLSFFIYALWRARQAGLFEDVSFDLRSLPRRCPGITRFIFATNGDGFVRVLRDIDVFIVNAVLGLAAAGLYRVARLLTQAMGQLTGPFYQSVYPELARFLAANDHAGMRTMMRQSALILGCLTFVPWIGFLLVGEPFLSLVFGAEFAAAYPLAVWCLAGMVIWGLVHPLSPALMAWQKAELVLVINLVTTCIYVVLMYVLTSTLGLIGAGVALSILYLVWGLMMQAVVSRQWKLAAAGN